MTPLVVILVLLAVAVAVSHNRLVRAQVLVEEAERQVAVELRRRDDLLPALAEATRRQAARERALLAAQLTETEDRLAAARRFQAGSVRALNARVAAFPTSLVATVFGIEAADWPELEPYEPPSTPPGR